MVPVDKPVALRVYGLLTAALLFLPAELEPGYGVILYALDLRCSPKASCVSGGWVMGSLRLTWL